MLSALAWLHLAAVQSGGASVVYNQDLGVAAMGAATSGGLAAAQFGVGEYAAAHNIANETVTKAAMRPMLKLILDLMLFLLHALYLSSPL